MNAPVQQENLAQEIRVLQDRNAGIGFFVLWFGLVGMLCLVYWPAIYGGLVWDDIGLVQSHGLLSMQDWFKNTFGTAFLQNHYRPLPLLTIMLGSLPGEQYFVLLAHAGNIVIFCLNTLLVMALVHMASSQRLLAPAVAGLLYAMHPAFMEPVVWVSGRCDLLLTFFCLLGLWADTVLVGKPTVRILAVCMCMFGAALSKETAVVFPVIWLGWRLYCTNTGFTPGALRVWLRQDHAMRDIVLVGVTGCLYLALRYAMIGHFLHALGNHDALGMLARVLLAAKTFIWFILLQFFPHYDLSVVYLFSQDLSWNDVSVLAGFAIFALLLVLLFLKGASVRLKYLIVVWLVLFFPMSNLVDVRLAEGFTHLRFMMLPATVLIVFGVPLLLGRLQQATTALRGILALVGVFWVLVSFLNLKITVPLWGNNTILWEWVITTKPASRVGWSNYAMTLHKQGKLQECIATYGQAEQQQAGSLYLTVAVALCHYEHKEVPEAYALLAAMFQSINTTVNMDPGSYSFANYLYGLVSVDKLRQASGPGNVSREQFHTIQELFQTAIRQNPGNIPAIYALSVWQFLNGEPTTSAANLVWLMRERSIRYDDVMKGVTTYGWLSDAQLAELGRLLQP